jgi:hypothetical protein
MKRTGIIEKYITDHRDEFDIEEPERGHFERFLDKQHTRGKRPAEFSWRNLLQAAAVTVFLVISSLLLYEKYSGGGGGEMYAGGIMTLSDIDPEYREAEIYYTALINGKYDEIRSFDFQSPQEQALLLKELSEMDSNFRSLEKELNRERGNQMIINAMIMHYQLQVDIMSDILDQLQRAAGHTDTEKDDIYTGIYYPGHVLS